MSRKNPLLQRLEYAAYRLVARGVSKLSDDSVAKWGARVGNLTRVFARRRHRLAVENLRATLPERAAEADAIVRECWRHFGREALGYIRVKGQPLDELAARCPFVNEEILRDGLAAGKGVLLISAHYGGWEVAGLAITAHAPNVMTVARPLDNALLESELARDRARTGVAIVDRRHAARGLLKTLNDNGVIILLPDQAVLPREGALIPFLGRPAWTTDAPAKMALRVGSTIVFAFCIPGKPGQHRLEFEEPIRVEELSEGERDPVALTRRINDVISRRIAARPELWLWMHDRWKGTAAGTRSEVLNGE